MLGTLQPRLGREKRLGKEFLAEGFAPFLPGNAPGGEEALS